MRQLLFLRLTGAGKALVMDSRYPARPAAAADPYNIGVVPESAWADLLALDPWNRARAAGAVYQPGQGFKVPFLGGSLSLTPATALCGPPRGERLITRKPWCW